MPGALVCAFHGGKAPQTEQAALVSQFVDTVAEAGPARPVWQVLLHATAMADQRMRENGDSDSIRLAAGLASESIKSRAAELEAEAANGGTVAEDTAAQIVDAVTSVVSPVLAEVGGRRHDDVANWVHVAVSAALRGQSVPPLPAVDREVTPAVPVRRMPLAIGPGREVAPGASGLPSVGDHTGSGLEGAESPVVGRTVGAESHGRNSAGPEEDPWSTEAGQWAWLEAHGLGGSVSSTLYPDGGRDRG